MKGRNKLVFVMFAILALVATGVCFAFTQRKDKVNYVTAAEIPGYTADLNGVIFSAERVYFAEKFETKGSAELKYGNYQFERIETGYKTGETDTGTRYFGHIGLSTGNESFNHKDIIYDGDFVIVDDTESGKLKANTTETPSEDVDIKQGVMITLGGYYRGKDADGRDAIITNASTGESGSLQENGDNLRYVVAQAYLNEDYKNPIPLPSARSFKGGEYEDFTWFIPATEETEGHYEITFTYMTDERLEFHFDFYLLLRSEYTNKVSVNGKDYSRRPEIEGDGVTSSYNNYVYKLGGSLGDSAFPRLTYDYTRYELVITHSSGDVTKTINVEYDDAGRNIKLSSKVHNDEDVKYYPVPVFNTDEKILTLMFADNGKYTFDFVYIYNYKGQKIQIPENQEKFDKYTLDIHGYQLKYSKSGVNSADMEYLEIYRNNTMFILLNGFTDISGEKSSANLGINYKLIDDADYKTGDIENREHAIIPEMPTDLEDDIPYQKTDRGIWLTLNDEYYFSADDGIHSYYYYSAEKFTGALNQNLYDPDTDPDGKQRFTKVTTFTKPGYYLVQVAYKYGAGESKPVGYQYFAFEITSATPILDLFKIDVDKSNVVTPEDEEADPSKEKNVEEFYAYEYTNQNVCATWKDPDIFESTIQGKLYYSTNKYEQESVLREAADRGINTSVRVKDYNKKTLIKDSGSYLLVLEVGGTATKTYTYFTIDKDEITGLTVHEIQEFFIGNKIAYRLKTDANLNPITHTEKAIVDVNFALDWDAKQSGAKINATYRYTPFVKNNTETNGKEIVLQSTSYSKYIINEYELGTITGKIGFEWATSALTADNVMVDQGVYEFALEDLAGNKLNYIMILDRTEGIIKATYGDIDEDTNKKSTYSSGQLVADYVEMDWGTHKAISLNNSTTSTTDSTVEKILGRSNGLLLDDELFKHYNNDTSNNLDKLTSMFKSNVDGNKLLVVANEYANIKMAPYDEGKDSYYRLISAKPSTDKNNPEKDIKSIISSNGVEYVDWPNTDENCKHFVTTLKDDESGNYTGTSSDLKILVNQDRLRRYVVEVKGANNVTGAINTKFSANITPDKTLGEVYSSADQSGSYSDRVEANGQNADFNKNGNNPNDEFEDDLYYKGQASDNGVFVFEWTDPSDQEFKVTEVKYEYYKLMDQSALNNITSDNTINTKDSEYYYYPYQYDRTGYILRFDGDIQTDSAYETANRTRLGEEKSVEVNRSNPINIGYETFYNDSNELVTRAVTQTGLYIITRTIKMTEGANTGSESSFSYAFFVDRNSIVGYDVNDIQQKLVGQFIHVAMPNSQHQQGSIYDNFTKQGLNAIKTPEGNDWLIGGETVYVYLETNKLPTRLNVPNGKYASGNVSDMTQLAHTSNLNMDLKLEVYYIDSYGLLPGSYQNSQLTIMSSKDFDTDKNGYIDFALDNTADSTIYKTARAHNDDGIFTLPGTYVFVIMDRVGKKVEDFKVTDYNKFMFGIKLIKDAPKTDVYAYADINGESDKVYSEDKILYTNQQYVDFVIPRERRGSNEYLAQLDIGSVEVWRTDLATNKKDLWLKLAYEYSNDSNNSTTPTIDQPKGQDLKDVLVYDNQLKQWIIKLDTGLKIDGYNIVSFKEYEYTISIGYILQNSDAKYYTYYDASVGKNVDFYSTTYNVIIDRTPNETNLNNLITGQEGYFVNYQTWLAEQNDTDFDGKLNDNFAYRDTVTHKDYYALTNKLYYEYASENGDLSNQAMYAMTIDNDTQLNMSGLSEVYYREIELGGTIAKTRMGLLPIVKAYFSATEYFGFREVNGDYQRKYVKNSNTQSYQSFINSGNVDGKFYEFVEIDLAGNYTQYVVYFNIEDTPNMVVKINAIDLDGRSDEPEDVLVKLGEDQTKSFVSYQYVGDIDYVAKERNGKYYPYYGQINVYRGTECVESIYLNTTTINESASDGSYSSKNSIESRLNDVLSQEGNYIIEYINNYNRSVKAVVNTYQDANHELNTLALVRKQTVDGKYYVEFSQLNTPVGNAWWYVRGVKVVYKNDSMRDETVEFTTNLIGGRIELVGSGDRVVRPSTIPNEEDRLYLDADKSYIITVTDVAGKANSVPISTIKEYVPYQLITVGNYYTKENVIYTANDVRIEYDKNIYIVNPNEILCNGNTIDANSNIIDCSINGEIILFADKIVSPSHAGSVRDFEVTVKLNNGENVVTYKVIIDTRTTKFGIVNLNKEDLSGNIKSYLNDGGVDENNVPIKDYSNPPMELINSDYYGTIINETINISWTKESDKDYFRYQYQLFEFVNANTCEELLIDANQTSYQISPKDKTTGKYIFKITITDLNGQWIASRVFGIMMSTSITGLYEVTYKSTGEPRDYSAITKWTEVSESLNITSTSTDVANALKLTTVQLQSYINNFGYDTAIPLYIANEELVLNSNKDNGVDDESYYKELDSGTKVWFYRIWRSDYQTFAVIMQIKDASMGGSRSDILREFKFATRENGDAVYDLKSLSSKTIYDKDADCYKLLFTSHYPYGSNVTKLEKRNKIMITISYAGQDVNTILGDDTDTTIKEFNNSGSYGLKVRDLAGNIHKFKGEDVFNLVLMKSNEILYTMTTNPEAGGKAPIKYAYYDKPVTLQIDRQNNYDINSITIDVFLNSRRYTGFEHPTGSTTYTFRDYGTYLIRVKANLLNIKDEDGDPVGIESEIVFTILNPNEARRALDFTSIYGYDIIKVESVSNGVYKDVTERFMSLLNDKANMGNTDVYNRLITYERAFEEFGSSIKGKMKFRVQYKVQDDELLPARYAEFSFTLNNQTATLNASIEAGGKTTKPVTIKFNPANIYELVGECYIVINGEKVDTKIDESTANKVVELTISAVGEYYVQLVGDSGNIITTFNFTIKEPMNTVSIILIVVVSALVIGLVATFIWLRTRMKVR